MFLFVRRYLFAKKSHSVVNIITTLSLVALSTPVAAIIILLSVFNGFGVLVDSSNRVVDPEIMVVRAKGNLFVIDSIDREAIMAVEGVESISMVSEQTMLFEHDGSQAVATLRGVDSAFLSTVPLSEGVVRGEYQITHGELDRMVMGATLAYSLGAGNIFDCFVDLYALKGSGFSSMLPMSNYTQRRIKLSALFSADAQSEGRYAITSLRAVQKLTGSQGKASQIFVGVAEGHSTEQVIERLREVVGSDFRVKSRYDLNPMLYDIIKYEKWGVLLISSLIMLLASFSLIGALSILIIEKRGDIVSLRSMGGSWQFIRRIFWGEGLFISSLGVALGAVVGSLLTLGQERFGWVKIPTQTFLNNFYPVNLQLLDVAIVVFLSLAISGALSYIIVKQMIKGDPKPLR